MIIASIQKLIEKRELYLHSLLAARVVQDKRKEMNFIVSDRVKVVFENSLDEETKQALNKFKEDLEKDCGVVEFSFGESFEIVKI
jgi:sensor domain CHASE-containing protein